MKKLTVLLTALLALNLLTGCHKNEDALDRAIDDLDKAVEDWAEEWENNWKDKGREISDRFSDEGKLHRWRILDTEGRELYLITDEAQVEALDDLLLDTGDDWDRLAREAGDPLYVYVYSQQETLKAGQDPDSREYEDLLTFTVSGTRDVVTMQIRGGLEELAVFGLRMEDVLTFDVSVPAETAEALRNPEQFAG